MNSEMIEMLQNTESSLQRESEIMTSNYENSYFYPPHGHFGVETLTGSIISELKDNFEPCCHGQECWQVTVR